MKSLLICMLACTLAVPAFAQEEAVNVAPRNIKRESLSPVERLSAMQPQVDNLTGEQRQRIGAINEAYQTRISPIVDEFVRLREQATQMMEAGNDQGQKEVTTQLMAKREELQQASNKMREEVLAVLNEEQRAQYQHIESLRTQKQDQLERAPSRE